METTKMDTINHLNLDWIIIIFFFWIIYEYSGLAASSSKEDGAETKS